MFSAVVDHLHSSLSMYFNIQCNKISYFVPEHVVGLLMKYNLNTRLQYLSRCHIAEAPWSPSMIIIFICDAGCAVDTVKLSSE